MLARKFAIAKSGTAVALTLPGIGSYAGNLADWPESGTLYLALAPTSLNARAWARHPKLGADRRRAIAATVADWLAHGGIPAAVSVELADRQADAAEAFERR